MHTPCHWRSEPARKPPGGRVVDIGLGHGGVGLEGSQRHSASTGKSPMLPPVKQPDIHDGGDGGTDYMDLLRARHFALENKTFVPLCCFMFHSGYFDKRQNERSRPGSAPSLLEAHGFWKNMAQPGGVGTCSMVLNITPDVAGQRLGVMSNCEKAS